MYTCICSDDNVLKKALSHAATDGKRDMMRHLLSSEAILKELSSEVCVLIRT